MTETFAIVPAQLRLSWVLLPVLLFFAFALGLLGMSLVGGRTARFEISPEGLRLRGDLYGRLIPAGQIRGGAARAVNLRADTSLQTRVRTLGTAVPGYRAGWFRLRDGEKALLYLTDPTSVVYVPTTAGYAVLLSVADPERFVAAIRRVAPGA